MTHLIMSNYYVYLISSLPMLHPGAKPPFTSEKFLNMCEELVPDEDLEAVRGAGQWPKWLEFDTGLRNELVKIRAAKKHLDPAKYLRGTAFAASEAVHAAAIASRNPSALDAERALDAARWHFLDELSMGHYFDLNFLIIYALKLGILERWARVDSADPAKEVRQLC
ncbi:MAG: hypothetical protein COW11_02735 [Candidatus Omnitrophica bacterium CG12_big_fil_rev_8_21_14_0_65_43_15]|uniref:DUF2764 domain-containing protein n=1 Tax=Candidatus Taenaricola geysiri TaxID=1974752 RepID=A0A2J0LFB4_9BACT|nr:MAG: hypothetical protein AUJ89_04925 [Candidatus Omnitrophica bacterium CG1_02_43_210]PIW66541.1 MAG: hypothetical protein COW11_02735 [Candidatus Omnitrophica bacterium CG12_big_fil_rev_8_21_14_0_65_43_15]PIW80199.1 MAG: hypothetical protein COZ98_03585 [Candidatus Omnitrophica bacterium CG_4_8_14_3_um_filter_43_15]PIY84073.1 MAG: hypothetical protein COY77_04315 [Candidatus Omnitrophica bacterium CG_4_10_14_0_8_um_filter_43_18]